MRPFHRQPPDARTPFSFQWHITDACDQRCKHCYIYAGAANRMPARMSWPDMLTVLDNCLDFCRRYDRRPLFFITGGDPILRPDFWRLLEHLHRMGIPFVILGNPYHIDLKACRRLKKLGCLRYQLSLDGLAATHDALRRPGSYRETLAALERLNQAGLDSAVMTTVSAANLAELPAIIDAVVAAGAGVFSFARYCPTGDGVPGALSPEDYREALSACRVRIRAHLDAGCRTRFDKKDHLWTLLDWEEGRFRPPEDAPRTVLEGGCHCGIDHLTILPDGGVMACRRVPDSRIGSALHDRLADLWLRPMDAYRRIDRFERCAGCRLLPWCRGCPAVARATSGSFYAPDPQCWRVVE